MVENSYRYKQEEKNINIYKEKLKEIPCSDIFSEKDVLCSFAFVC